MREGDYLDVSQPASQAVTTPCLGNGETDTVRQDGVSGDQHETGGDSAASLTQHLNNKPPTFCTESLLPITDN